MKLSGKIVAGDETLPSAHVIVTDADGNAKTPTKGVSTDMDGSYSIDVNPTDYLTASFVGLGKKTVKASEVCSQSRCNFDFNLGGGENILEEVLIIGKSNKTDWKKIALISGISIVGLVALYFGIKKISR